MFHYLCFHINNSYNLININRMKNLHLGQMFYDRDREAVESMVRFLCNRDRRFF